MDEVTTQEVGTSQQLAALYGALAAAQGEFQPIVKNRDVEIRMREGGKYRFKYADLEEITAKTRPALSKHGLATSQPIVKLGTGTGTALRTILVHKDGGMLFSEIPLPASTNGGDIKNYGATLTYLRRYAKTAILDVAADDDLDENGQGADDDGAGNAEPEFKQPAARSKPAPQEGNVEKLTTGMVGTVRAQLKAKDKSEQDLLKHFGAETLEGMARSQINEILDWIKAE